MLAKIYLRAIFICFSLLAITVINFPLFAKTEIAKHVYKIDSLNEISDLQPAETLYFFDIDDTLIDSKWMLGTRAWRKYIAAATKDDKTRNWHDFFTLFVAQHYPVKTVETQTAHFIKQLQERNYVVAGLTARERHVWYDTPAENVDAMTIQQLRSVDIEFENGVLESSYPSLTGDSEYYQGVFFSNLDLKGDYLKKLFKNQSQIPHKILFIDDKWKNIESVAAVLDEMGIEHETYWYCAIESRGEKFDPLIANIQLYYLWKSGGKQIISDGEAFEIAQKNPEQDADYYLQRLLNEIGE